MLKVTGAWAAVTAFAAFPALAAADVIFGMVGSVLEVVGPAPTGVSPGAPILMFYRFDPSTPDTDPSPDQGAYIGAVVPSGSAVGVGGYILEPASGGIHVINDGFGGDSYRARLFGPTDEVNFDLNDLDGTAFSNDSLPSQLAIEDFEIRRIEILAGTGAGAWEARGLVFKFFITYPCYPDCNQDDSLNIADFGCFTTKFAQGSMYADCNGDDELNIADFGCFQTEFAKGCP